MNKCVLDSSALLAFFNSEIGADKVGDLLPKSCMSAVNVIEVISEIDSTFNIPQEQISNNVFKAINQIVPLDFEQATMAGYLRKTTKHLGLSLGDRACIALGITLKCPVYTADKAWEKLKIEGLEVRLIR